MADQTALIGSDVRIDFSFTNLGGTTLTDPSDVYLFHRKPDLTEVMYQYEVDPEVTRLGVGQYRFVITMGNEPNTHWFRMLGNGSVNEPNEVSVEVLESKFLEPLPT